MMMILRPVRVVLRTFAGGALVAVAVVWAGAGPAAAVARAAPCTPIVILQPLCPKTTTPPTTAPPTTAPPTTKAPATRPATTAATAGKKAVVSSSSRRATPGAAASLGSGTLPVLLDPALGSGATAVAPQLAGTPTPSTTAARAGVPLFQPQLSVVGHVKGLPNDHSTSRILLSFVTILVAAVAAAQLPASRRSPRSDGDPLGPAPDRSVG